MWRRADLKSRAKSALSRNYWPMVLVGFIMILCGRSGSGSSSGRASQQAREEISRMSAAEIFSMLTLIGVIMLIVMAIGLLFCLFVKYPFEVGCSRFLIINRKVTPDMGEIVSGYKESMGNTIKILFLRDLYIFLWSLLFLIPGIVKSYEYRMIPFLLAEYPDISVQEAFEISKRMMDGEKWNTFVLDASFFGWALLSAITIGIVGIFWYNPYYFQTNAELYGALSRKENPYFERCMRNYPGGSYPGGPGAGNPYQWNPYQGGAYPGGTYQDGAYPGGTYPGGTYPGGSYPGGTYPDGSYPGGTYPGGSYPGDDF